MASLYKNRDVWYVSVTIGKDRITRSLRTSDYTIAKKLKPYIESQIILELTTYSDVDGSEESDIGPNSDQVPKWSENGPKNGLKSDLEFQWS